MTSRDPKRSSRDPNMLKVQYLENSWRCYLATIANTSLLWVSIRSRVSQRQLGFLSDLSDQWPPAAITTG